jgi:hypothetical protein
VPAALDCRLRGNERKKPVKSTIYTQGAQVEHPKYARPLPRIYENLTLTDRLEDDGSTSPPVA